MAQITSLSPLALPGRTQTFAAKAAHVPAVDVWAKIALEGYSPTFADLTADAIYIGANWRLYPVNAGTADDGLYVQHWNGVTWNKAFRIKEP